MRMLGKSILVMAVCGILGALVVYTFGLPLIESNTQPVSVVETAPKAIETTNMQDYQGENETAKMRAITLATQALKERGLDTQTIPGGSRQSIALIDAGPWRDNPNTWQLRFDYEHITDQSVTVTVDVASGKALSVEEHRE